MFRKILTSALLSFVIVGGFFIEVHPSDDTLVSFVGETYAADCGGTGQPACTTDQATKNKLDGWLVTMNQMLYFLNFAVSPAVMLAGWLMSPDWTSGDLFGIRPVLHSLWVLVSNITYFIYAILLIFIALATIFNSQNYSYKKLLPRLALGIILVPLTWWFVQFIISLSSIVTASVINVPVEVILRLETERSPSTETWLSKPSIPRRIVHDAAFGNGGSLTVKPSDCDATTCISPKDVLTNSTGMFGGLMVYAYGIFRFQDNIQINTGVDVVKVIAQLINQTLIMALMFLVFGLLIIALVFMLLMRAIKLWFYAIFSPLMTLRYVIGDGLFGGKENSEGFEIKEFIGLAFVPALVGLALSFGIVIIAALHFSGSGNGTPTPPSGNCLTSADGCKVVLFGNTSNTIVTKQMDDGDGSPPYTQTVITFGGINYVYYGTVSGVSGSLGEALPSALSAAGGLFGTIIIDLIALIFLWTAFMAAKNVSKVASAAIKPFEEMGKKVGSMAATLPKYTPIPGTGGFSLKTADKLMNNAQVALEHKGDVDFKKSGYAKIFGGDKVTSAADEVRFKDYLKNAGSHTNSDAFREAGEILKKTASTNQEYSSLFPDLVRHLNEQFGDSKYKKMEALQRMGYDKEKAELIIDRTKDSKDGKINTNDSELISALKSVASSSKGSGSSIGYSGTAGANNTVSLNFNGASVVSARGKTDAETKDNIIRGISAELENLKKAKIQVDETIMTNMLKGAGILSVEATAMAKEILKKSEFKDLVKPSDPTSQPTPPNP